MFTPANNEDRPKDILADQTRRTESRDPASSETLRSSPAIGALNAQQLQQAPPMPDMFFAAQTSTISTEDVSRMVLDAFKKVTINGVAPQISGSQIEFTAPEPSASDKWAAQNSGWSQPLMPTELPISVPPLAAVVERPIDLAPPPTAPITETPAPSVSFDVVQPPVVSETRVPESVSVPQTALPEPPAPPLDTSFVTTPQPVVVSEPNIPAPQVDIRVADTVGVVSEITPIVSDNQVKVTEASDLLSVAASSNAKAQGTADSAIVSAGSVESTEAAKSRSNIRLSESEQQRSAGDVAAGTLFFCWYKGSMQKIRLGSFGGVYPL